jgi:hypothetical protein
MKSHISKAILPRTHNQKSRHSRREPSVTLVLTTRNRTRYLKESIGCILAQDYPNLDILISDNGSTDDTPVLTRSLSGSDPRVRFRRNIKGVPQHQHFSQCVEEAIGEYFILLNDDDRINPTFISNLVDVAERNPDVNVVVPAQVTIDELGATKRVFDAPKGEVFDGPAFLIEAWLCAKGAEYVACLVTILIKAEVVRYLGGYRSFTCGKNMENLLLVQCGVNARIGFSPRAVFEYREYSQSYGRTAKPEDIASSGYQFLQYLRRDPITALCLSKVSKSTRKQIVAGVARATAKEVILNIQEFDLQYDRKTLSRLFKQRCDIIFCVMILREALRHNLPAVHRSLRPLVRLLLSTTKILKRLGPGAADRIRSEREIR